MRQSEFADLLVVEGIYSTRSAALEAVKSGKVKMNNVVFEDIPHVFPILDAWVASKTEASINRRSEMDKKGYICVTARQAANIDDDVWPAVRRNFAIDLHGNTRITLFAPGTTVICPRYDPGSYESLMPGQWVKDTPGRWRYCFSAEDRSAEGCVAFYDHDGKLVHKSLPDTEVFI